MEKCMTYHMVSEIQAGVADQLILSADMDF